MMFAKSRWCWRVILFTCVALLGTAFVGHADGPVLGIHGPNFTIDGNETFLLGCSYYGALGIDDEESMRQDLDDLHQLGFNWIRVWATWSFDDLNVSAVASDGSIREPFMARLKRTCEIAGTRGMTVDVTVTRGKDPFPSKQPEHVAAMTTLATALKPYRNVYFDVGNERDVGDARYVSKDEVADLIRAVKRIDALRICTASCVPDTENVGELIALTGIDFIAPHLSRTSASPAQTEPYCRDILSAMRGSGRIVPVHLQEPFRRGYADWRPKAEDFKTDLIGALNGGAAGWCFHNGATRNADGDRPRRSFDMRSGEGRLFSLLDEEEKRFFTMIADINVQRTDLEKR